MGYTLEKGGYEIINLGLIVGLDIPMQGSAVHALERGSRRCTIPRGNVVHPLKKGSGRCTMPKSWSSGTCVH